MTISYCGTDGLDLEAELAGEPAGHLEAMLLGRVVDGLDEMAADGDGDQPVGEVEFLLAVIEGFDVRDLADRRRDRPVVRRPIEKPEDRLRCGVDSDVVGNRDHSGATTDRRISFRSGSLPILLRNCLKYDMGGFRVLNIEYEFSRSLVTDFELVIINAR